MGCKVVNKAAQEKTEAIEMEDIDSMIIPPRRFYAKVQFLNDVASDKVKLPQQNIAIESEMIGSPQPRRIRETNLDFESSDDADDILDEFHEPEMSSSGDVFASDEKETEPEIIDLKESSSEEFKVESRVENRTSASDGVLSYYKDEELNSVLVIQLFNLVGRLTDEMKKLETDCVEMRAELADLRQKSEMQSDAAAVSGDNVAVCPNCSSVLGGKVEFNEQTDECKIPNIPLDMQREVQIPIALTRSGVKEKRKKTIRERVFGLGRVRSKRNNSFTVNNSKSRFSFDGEECDDFSIGRRPSEPTAPSEPIYDLPPFELDERFKTDSSKQPIGNSGGLFPPGFNGKSDFTKSPQIGGDSGTRKISHPFSAFCGEESVIDGNSLNNKSADQFGLKLDHQIRRIQSEGRRTWQEIGGDLKQAPKGGTSEGIDRGQVGVVVTSTPQVRRGCLSERDMNVDDNQQKMAGKGSQIKFMESIRLMERKEARFLEDETDSGHSVSEKITILRTASASELESAPIPPTRFSTPPPPRRVIRPPDDLPELTHPTVKELYTNWMEFKSTKAPRLSPDHSDLKVRFDDAVQKKEYFKDEVPKMSSLKAGVHLKLRVRNRLRHFSTSLAKKVKRGDRGSRRLIRVDSGDYEDLDFLDQKVTSLAEQSNQLCRNLALEAQSGLRFNQAPKSSQGSANNSMELDDGGFSSSCPMPRRNLPAVPEKRSSDESYIDLSALEEVTSESKAAMSSNPSEDMQECCCSSANVDEVNGTSVQAEDSGILEHGCIGTGTTKHV